VESKELPAPEKVSLNMAGIGFIVASKQVQYQKYLYVGENIK
jgi:hypothetical protein